tara:strand:- start:199 stop:2046 length:1848 start_codon:yes stop_codon:yes gene_type:complete
MVKENLSFQAEVGKLLHLVTHSLYKDKQIFLREIISNASDACDKLRYANLTNDSLIEDSSDLSVKISIDQKKSQLTVEDNGIGMSKKELVDNLGTIARSGTAKFIEQLSENKDNSNLIGQFGVGFYSVFMVAKKVDVYSTKAGTKTSWLWSSAGTEKFSISPTSDGPSRGTRIVIELDDQSQEYTKVENLKPIIKKYSDHLNLPILFNNDGENEQLNTGMALWARQKRTIKQEQYFEFYQSTFGQFDEPLHISHFQTEGQLSYIGLMYIPSTPAFDLFMPESKNKIKLYVKRVFISDQVDELLPQYLRFVHGIIDSEDLPLNVSRETLQFNPMIDRINKRVVNQILKELTKIAEKDKEKYNIFWKHFGSVLKEGIYTDSDQRDKILKISKFASINNEEFITLDEYILNMPKNQKYIYYLSGQNVEELKNSPHLEALKSQKMNVLLITDPVDEVWMPIVNQFEEKPFKSITHGDLELKENKKTSDENSQKELDGLLQWLKEKLNDEVKDVRISSRLSDSPACIISDEGDIDINLANMLRERGQLTQEFKRVLEINPEHELIVKMQKKLLAKTSKQKKELDNIAYLLLDQAKILEGEKISDTSNFSKRIVRLMNESI